MIIGISGKIDSGKDTVGKIIQYLIASNIEDIKQNDGTFHPSSEEDFTAFLKCDGYSHSGWKIVKFADALKDIVCILTGCTREQLESPEFKNSKLPDEWIRYGYANGFYKYYKNGKEETIMNNVQCDKERYDLEYRTNWQTAYKIHSTYRELLQYIGTDLLRNKLHSDVWVNALFSKYKIIGMTEGWYPTYNNPDNSGCDIPAEPILPNWIITDVRFPNEVKAIKDRGGIIIRINRYDITGQGKLNPHTSETALDDYNFDYTIDNFGTIEELIEKVKDILIIETLARIDDRCVSITQDEKVFKERPIMNLYRELTEQEEVEFRQWARDNFNPLTDTVDSLWHPTVKDECNKIINEQINKL